MEAFLLVEEADCPKVEDQTRVGAFDVGGLGLAAHQNDQVALEVGEVGLEDLVVEEVEAWVEDHSQMAGVEVTCFH